MSAACSHVHYITQKWRLSITHPTTVTTPTPFPERSQTARPLSPMWQYPRQRAVKFRGQFNLF